MPTPKEQPTTEHPTPAQHTHENPEPRFRATDAHSEDNPHATCPPGLMTLAEVSTLLRVSPWMLSRLVNNGTMPSVRIGRRRLITPTDYQAFISAKREEFSRRGW